MEIFAVILKILGAGVSFISGLCGLSIRTRQGDRLTAFGRTAFISLVLGVVFSATGAFLDWKLKSNDDIKHKEEIHYLQQAADAQRYGTGDADVSVAISVDKGLPDLQPIIQKLDQTLEYAKAHCRAPGGVANCKDFVIRSVMIDELRFDEKSSLLKMAQGNGALMGVLTKLGIVVRFYHNEFTPSLDLSSGSIGGIVITPSTISAKILYEYDGYRLRMFYDARLPPEAFKRAGVLSIVDLLGRGGTARPFARGIDVCPSNSIEHDCDIHLFKILKSTNIEDITFLFPHRKNFSLNSSMNHSEDKFNIPYIYCNFPPSLDGFRGDYFYK